MKKGLLLQCYFQHRYTLTVLYLLINWFMSMLRFINTTHKLALSSLYPMRDIIEFPLVFPPGQPCLVKTDQSRKTNRAHVATQPSSESCLFYDWRD